MRKSMTHLRDASPLLSRRRLERPLTAPISTCCWQSHLRDLLYCFGDTLLPRSRLYKTRQYHHQRSRFYSTSSCAVIPNHSLSSTTSSSSTLTDAGETPSSTDIPPSIQLYGALAIFNFTDHVTLSNLEEALRQQQAEKAWQLFCTLTSKRNTSGNNDDLNGQRLWTDSATTTTTTTTANSNDVENLDDESMNLMAVPYHHCIDLYALLLYAQDLALHTNVIAMRQQQIDKVAAYVEEQLGQSKSIFINSVPRRAVPTYKRFQQSLQNRHQQSAWKYYTQILAEDPIGAPSLISRNHCFQFLSVVMHTKKRYLNDQQKQDMIQLVTTAHEGIPCQQGRRLTADAIEWIALIYSQYDHNQPRHGRRFVHEFLKDSNNQQPTADTIGELVWRLLPYDIKTAHMILNTMHQRGLPQNESTYNNIIKAYSENRQYNNALGVFEQMLTIGVPPTVPILNSVLHIFADQGLTDRAVYIWDTLHSLELVPDTATYSEMIRCFGHVGQLKQCLHYYHLIVQQQQNQQQQQHQQQQQQQSSSSTQSVTSPNLYTYSTLIEAYGKRNDVRGVLRWFQTLLKQGLEPNHVIMSNVLKALGKHHQQTNMMEAVDRIAKQCMMAGIKADTTLYTLLLTLQADATPITRTKTSSSSTPPPPPPPSQSQSTVSSSSVTSLPLSSSSNSIENNTELEFVLQSQREMLAKCIEPNVYTYTALIDLCGKHGYLDTARQIFDLMQQSDRHQPTTVTYCAMLDVLRYANHKEQVDLLLYDYLVQSKSNGSQGNRLQVDFKMKHQFRCLHGC